MEDQLQTTKPISDDQELAKVLAGVSQSANEITFEEEPSKLPTVEPEPVVAPAPQEPVALQTPALIEADYDPEPANTALPDLNAVTNDGTNDLESIKKDALTELRPLVDKLDLAPEEKFDTYLLLLRSTDDKALVAPAHKAAQSIVDETRRAQALLDIIKEIDYFSNPTQQAA